MSYHIHPHAEEQEEIDHRTTISNNWQVDEYGFVKPSFAVECMFRYGTVKYHDVASTKSLFVRVYNYPDEVTLEEAE